MADSVNRFNARVENYAKFRPTYPNLILDLLATECGLTESSIVADVGSGTGIFSELLLRNGNSVFGVEPNAQMRSSAENLLSQYRLFRSIDGSAEATTLDSDTFDFVTAAQSFHWFDRTRARAEFARILKPNGWVVLIWNERRLDSTPFLRAYEQLLLQYGTDYQNIRHENVSGEIADFFSLQGFRYKSFENIQTFNFEGLMGRVLSSSYTPEPGDPAFEPMIASLRDVFDEHKQHGTVAFEYDSKSYYGQLKPLSISV